MIKAIIFDFFDVIRTDGYKAWLKQRDFVMEGGFLEASQRMDRGEITVEQFLVHLSKLTGDDPQQIQDEMDESAKVDYEIVSLIEQLKGRYRIALLSNGPSTFIRDVLREHNLERYFDEIVISSEVGLVKPRAEIFELTLQRLGVAPEEAVFVDDNEHHVRGAREAGLTSLQYFDLERLKGQLRELAIL